ncbi:hypothetical protein HU200_056336 [Digitaria exilis]|uniref:Uncharacterized protein n=1 Tax=Digitaria exilis TaxID=1010633 RepID=A0A835AM97_9POAL|nr:hypothetical protein HU200_056336 [Digitaria exilis]
MVGVHLMQPRHPGKDDALPCHVSNMRDLEGKERENLRQERIPYTVASSKDQGRGNCLAESRHEASLVPSFERLNVRTTLPLRRAL